jgi:hypothetical protein
MTQALYAHMNNKRKRKTKQNKTKQKSDTDPLLLRIWEREVNKLLAKDRTDKITLEENMVASINIPNPMFHKVLNSLYLQISLQTDSFLLITFREQLPQNTIMFYLLYRLLHQDFLFPILSCSLFFLQDNCHNILNIIHIILPFGS